MSEVAARLPGEAQAVLRVGGVIPAHPLALTAERRLSPEHQRGLTRHYLEAGAIGIATAVHTTQFALREHGLLDEVLRLSAEECEAFEQRAGRRVLRIAGVIGSTEAARDEARRARAAGYDLALLSLAALGDADDASLVEHCRRVGEELPLFGFYLQPAVGGRRLSPGFWRAFAELEAVQAIKVAPFDRYATQDVVQAVLESSRWPEVALYTGNDDHIVLDLVSEWSAEIGGEQRRKGFVGGLLGHWAVWPRRAVALFETIRRWRASGEPLPHSLLRRAEEETRLNGALFDAAHGFRGCIASIQAVLHVEGRIPSALCLDPSEQMSPGQWELLRKLWPADEGLEAG